ncbi:MAG: type VI secretion system baseplate subunit TssK [Pseudomonadota bacterium]
MATHNKVLWQEGLFILPHHFQQESRYLEHHTNQRIEDLRDYTYGLTNIHFDDKALSSSKLQILSASGVMPDGATFNIPVDTPAPAPLTLDNSHAGHIIYLALPIYKPGIGEVQKGGRYQAISQEIKDQHTASGEYRSLETAQLQLRLMPESEDRSDYHALAITRIKGKSIDEQLQLDHDYYPTSLSVSAIPPLRRFISEIAGLMRERAKNLADRIGAPGQAGVAEVTDFLLLQTLNRLQPHYHHLGQRQRLHPEELYDDLLQTCGELATFHAAARQADDYLHYDHNHPGDAFHSLEDTLRQSLGTLMQPRATPIPIEKREYGTYVAMLNDHSLLDSSDFILAVKARMPLEQLRRQYQQQTKVASLEKLAERVRLQLPGIPLNALPVAPRHLPYHAGYTYFQLDRQNDAWSDLMQNATAGFGFHIAGNFPELELEFWALRRD